ncbi:MAG: molecular chaperone HtpG [Firmicutes bacterium]|nr:molecular chaperone HtpG [Bacillota bacterium]
MVNLQKKEFQTESKKLLNLMINSIYTHKEVFLRELISNASDALDKLFIREIGKDRSGISRENLKIQIEVDQENRKLKVSDNGCGMSEAEMDEHLGVIAKSGTLDFKNTAESAVEVIGQFGVGFYSAFMVSDKVQVISKAYGSDQAFCWESEGEDGYTIAPCQKEGHGTDVILYLREDSDEEDYSQYLEEYTIRNMVKKYSDYIRYPIIMEVEDYSAEEGEEVKTKEETLNSMVPVWRLSKEEQDEKANQFYKDKFFDFNDPLTKISVSIEGMVSYRALLFIPAQIPYGYYTKNFEKGLQLYSNDVLIMETCPDLLPDHFAFVRGVVDSADFSLNISREMLQHDRQLKLIAKNLERRIRNELTKMLTDDRETYEKFWSAFGLQLKYGVYQDFGMHKEDLQDLLMFHSLEKGKNITLKEYIEAMPEEQKEIYYATGETHLKSSKMPQTEMVRAKGFDILSLSEEIDEFALKILREYDEKPFRSVSDAQLDVMSPEEKKELEDFNAENQSLLYDMTETLKSQIKAVRLSTRLKDNPVCLVSEGEISLEMERVLEAMPDSRGQVKAERILEINPHHPIFTTLQSLAGKPQELKKYTELLYDQALLMAGFSLDDPTDFSNRIIEFMTTAKKEEE